MLYINILHNIKKKLLWYTIIEQGHLTLLAK